MPAKLTAEQIKKDIENFPYKHISGEVQNTYSRLNFQCDDHGIFNTTLKAIRKGFKCIKCSAKIRAQKSKKSEEAFLSRIKNSKISMISRYVDYHTLIKFKCSEHGEFEKTPYAVADSAGNGCISCARKTQGKPRTSIEEIKKIVENQGYELISKEYTRYDQKLEIKCSIHGVSFKKLEHIKTSCCSKCNYTKTGINRRMPKEQAEKIVKKFNYKLGEDFFASSKKCTFVCSKHGPFKSTLNDVKDGHGCSSCTHNKSGPNDELYNFVIKQNLSAEKNYRNLISPKEIDIYIPSKKIAIEYCGLHWHSDRTKDKNYHKNKHLSCLKKDTKLITIFEDEWLNRKEQILNILKAKIGVLPKIYARKTIIKEIEKQTAKDFLNKWHLQGSCFFIKALGIYFQGELVGCATLSKHHRNNRNEAVLSRVCFADKAVVGGSSKLLKQIVNIAKELGYQELVSWSDNRWSDGGVYRKLNMEPKELPIDYSYVLRQKRFSKQSCQKKHLLKKGAVGSTEAEMAKSLGYHKIWDCGKVRWSLKLK